MPFDAAQLGRNIERHRRRKGLTQGAVARDLSVTDATVSNWEQGINAPPLHRLHRLAELLQTTVVTLLTEGDDDITLVRPAPHDAGRTGGIAHAGRLAFEPSDDESDVEEAVS